MADVLLVVLLVFLVVDLIVIKRFGPVVADLFFADLSLAGLFIEGATGTVLFERDAWAEEPGRLISK